ncbi:MAG: hypothetical protein MK110_18615 [Fuerstiella sp.]|nr:hypothetical protein [Fuerstiella sp.]
MDLFLALVLMTLTSLWAMITGRRLGQFASNRSRLVAQIVVVTASTLYLSFIWNQSLVTLILPHAALIVLANWLPMIASFFTGMYWSATEISRTRRLFLGSLTLLLASYSIVAPIVGQAPRCAPAAPDSLLISQSTPYTCSPAVAASLLRLHGIAASEAEMARLCLTRKGTHWMGLYRGLKLMTQETSWDVMALPFSRDAIMNLDGSPALLSINIDPDLIENAKDHGFHGSRGHSVLVLSSRNDRELMVFDPAPSYGIECWNREILSWVSNGVILYLEPRNGSEQDGTVRTRINRATENIDHFAYISWRTPL